MTTFAPVVALLAGCFDFGFSLGNSESLVLFAQSDALPVMVAPGEVDIMVTGTLPAIESCALNELRYNTRFVAVVPSITPYRVEHVDCEDGTVLESLSGAGEEVQLTLFDTVDCGGSACGVELCFLFENQGTTSVDAQFMLVTEVTEPLGRCTDEAVTQLPPTFVYEIGVSDA